MSPRFSSTAYYTVQGFTGSSKLGGSTISGNSNHIEVRDSTVDGQVDVDTSGIVNGAILIDGNRFLPWNAQGGAEGRLSVHYGGGPGTQSSGVTVSNNEFVGPGCSDGIQIGSYGVVITGNVLHDLRQGSCGPHVDAIQLYGQSHTVIRNNVLYDNETGIIAYDGGNAEVIENNAIRSTARSDEAIGCGGCKSPVIRHNTVLGSNFINLSSKPGMQSTSATVTDNVTGGGVRSDTNTGAAATYAARDYNLCGSSSDCGGANSVTGTPVLSGGNNFTTLAAATLTSSSPGYKRASDASSMGVTAAGGGTTPPPSQPPPSDNTAPDTTITSAPANPTTSTSASIAFNANEPNPAFECKLDSGAYDDCTSPKAYTGLATGTHTFTVRATDVAGNTDASPAVWTWTISAPRDTQAPDTTITSAPANPTTSTSASIAFDANEPNPAFECKLDSGAYDDCTSPKAYNGLSVGSHTFTVRATDAAGNTDASPAVWTGRSALRRTPRAPETSITSGRTIRRPRRARRSRSAPASRRRRSSASSTRAPTRTAPARRPTPHCAPVRTHSACARRMRRATPTPRRPRRPGPSAQRRPRRLPRATISRTRPSSTARRHRSPGRPSRSMPPAPRATTRRALTRGSTTAPTVPAASSGR